MIYVLEDNAEIRDLQLYALNGAGFEATGFEDGAAFLAAVEKTLPELVILDIMLPDSSGLNILKKLRSSAKTARIPAILVTAKTTEADKIKGFDFGADDYISKPFSLIEFLARVRAVLRRSAPETERNILSCEGVELDMVSRTVTVEGETVELTYKEFEMLALMLKSPGRVFSRDVLLDEVWGMGFGGETRTVDMHIKTLRKKLGPCGERIKTVRNVGYKLSK